MLKKNVIMLYAVYMSTRCVLAMHPFYICCRFVNELVCKFSVFNNIYMEFKQGQPYISNRPFKTHI